MNSPIFCEMRPDFVCSTNVYVDYPDIYEVLLDVNSGFLTYTIYRAFSTVDFH